MPFVVTQACIQCKYTDCVTVCPMDCFLEGPNSLVIDPDLCIDCSMCVPECPVDAIMEEHDVPAGQSHFVDLNRRLARHPAWSRITRAKPPMAGHEHWAGVADKQALLRIDGGPCDAEKGQDTSEGGSSGD